MKNLRLFDLFDAAYLRLTAWYVAIIMIISMLFSFWVYTLAQHELRSSLEDQNSELAELQREGVTLPDLVAEYIRIDTEKRLSESRQRLISQIVLFNIGVLVAGAAASYALARRTMRPIEEAVEAQERFTADASHELRTPLAAMKSEIEVGLRDKSLSKSDTVELLKSNLEEVEHMGNLAEGLLTLTQDTVLDIKPVDLDEIVAKIAKRLKPLADAKNIEIKRELKPAKVQADEAALEKIAGILLDNAVKYSGQKTVVTVKTYQKDGRGVLEVQDQGVGIKATELPHIFDRFYRADTSRTKQHVNGHGLGLSIAKKLADQLDAKLEATSTPNKGSVFTFVVRYAER